MLPVGETAILDVLFDPTHVGDYKASFVINFENTDEDKVSFVIDLAQMHAQSCIIFFQKTIKIQMFGKAVEPYCLILLPEIYKDMDHPDVGQARLIQFHEQILNTTSIM